jgi:hypothetical protein
MDYLDVDYEEEQDAGIIFIMLCGRMVGMI